MHRGQLPIGGSGGGGDAQTGRPAYAPSLGEDLPSSGAMRPEQASAWYRRMSTVYAFGAWTLLGGLIFSGRQKRKSVGDEVEQKDVSMSESEEESGYELDLRKEVNEPPKGFYVETIITYKEDFVPLTDKILNYWKSWTGGPGPES